MKKTYKISEISLLIGLSVPTLRYYEELELLKPQRNSSNYREFTEADLAWKIGRASCRERVFRAV